MRQGLGIAPGSERRTSTGCSAVTVALPGAFAQVRYLGCQCGLKSTPLPCDIPRERARSASEHLRLASEWSSSESFTVWCSHSLESSAWWPAPTKSSRDVVRRVASSGGGSSLETRPNDRIAGVPLSGARTARSSLASGGSSWWLRRLRWCPDRVTTYSRPRSESWSTWRSGWVSARDRHPTADPGGCTSGRTLSSATMKP
jgi:hypothetical protein